VSAKAFHMEKYNLKKELKVFGLQVKTFPLGIKEAFGNLMKLLPDGSNRPYYGVSYMKEDGSIIYNAAAEEKYEGEAEKYNLERYIIEGGEYLTETINDWQAKTDSIKDVFHEMMQDNRVDKKKPVVEWYKTDEEMMCMVKTKN
jgi:hypothetical protein